ncbi:DNA-binding domain-containing protein [Vibrio fluvialis]|uniref:HvfC/BufC N-terminal domain-containing protein n=1 Tax=Vibrio fluvialis TaxID=676 RepID=UPI001C9C4543|nr:DNA-binding domain-containing protein [Vibrio fluvialis]MBY8216386.1 DNA-binding domain-containing protein [Vibrio fluvialis]MCG6369500.1 DNA-binding domain-containing protein [Vibrio fluvialis]MCG6377315.1 DNA-binding domain-containing protein [Vibrio fluvialis]WMN55574.1 DNA-binding domain-containing protein [Vibrio fluvialis]
MTLAQLQAQFARGLNYQAGGDECAIIADGLSADERLQIYRNNRVISLSEVLEATYPMLLAVLGNECFAALAREYVLSHPLTRGDVSHYGEGFAAVIERAQPVMQAAPYAAALARFEWALDHVQQQYAKAPRNEYQPLSTLSQVAPEQQTQLVFELVPWAAPFCAPFALFDLQRAMRDDDFSQLTLNALQSGIIACTADGEPWTQTLDEPTYQLLLAMHHRAPLGQIHPNALAALPAIMAMEIVAGFRVAAPNTHD